MRLVDSHCHLDAAEFDDDRAAVVARARAAGVEAQVLPATHAAGWPGLRAACTLAPGLHPAYGLHPVYLDRHADADLDALREWLAAGDAVAVGECGLDHFIDGLDHARQMRLFEAQLRLAREFDLPVIVHARRAVDLVTSALRRIGGLRGVVHSFSGSADQAARLCALGFHLGIGGPVTHERAQRLRGIVATLPLDHLLLETDAPDQPGAAHRGERNEPAHLVEVLHVVAALRGMAPEALAEATSRNARRLFALAG
jgi:TatD DNase family protein